MLPPFGYGELYVVMDLLGVFIFAVSGGLAGRRAGLDFVGVVVVFGGVDERWEDGRRETSGRGGGRSEENVGQEKAERVDGECESGGGED